MAPSSVASNAACPTLMTAKPGEEQDIVWAKFYTTCIQVTQKFSQRAKKWFKVNPNVEGLDPVFLWKVQGAIDAYSRERRRYVRTQERYERRWVTQLFNDTARVIWVSNGLDRELFNLALGLQEPVLGYDGDGWEDISDDDDDDDPVDESESIASRPPNDETTATTSIFDQEQQQNISSTSAKQQRTDHLVVTNQQHEVTGSTTKHQASVTQYSQSTSPATVIQKVQNQGTVTPKPVIVTEQQHQLGSVTTLQSPLKTQASTTQRAQIQKTQTRVIGQQHQKGQAIVTQQPQSQPQKTQVPHPQTQQTKATATEQQHQKIQATVPQPSSQRTRTLTIERYQQGQSTNTHHPPQITEFTFTVPRGHQQSLAVLFEHPEETQITHIQGDQLFQLPPVSVTEQQSQRNQATMQPQTQRSQAGVTPQQGQEGPVTLSKQPQKAQATMTPHSQKPEASVTPQRQQTGAVTSVTKSPQATVTPQQQQKGAASVTKSFQATVTPQQQQKGATTSVTKNTQATVTPQQQKGATTKSPQATVTQQKQQKKQSTAIQQSHLPTATFAQQPHSQPAQNMSPHKMSPAGSTQKSLNTPVQQQTQPQSQNSATQQPAKTPGVTPQAQNQGTAGQKQQGTPSHGSSRPFDFRSLGISEEWMTVMNDDKDNEKDAEYFRNMKGPSTQEGGKGKAAADGQPQSDEEGIWANADWGEWPDWWWEVLSGGGKITKSRYAEILAKYGASLDMDRCWAEFDEEE